MQRSDQPELDLELQVEFASYDGKIEGKGKTRTVSPVSVYFFTSGWQQLAEGQALELRIHGLQRYLFSTTFRTLTGTGIVLRVDAPREQLEGRGGVHAQCTWARLQR